MPSKNKAGCTCCGGDECYKLEDDAFTGSEPTSDWVEQTGNWSISGSVLQTSDADAILLATHEFADDNVFLFVNLSSIVAGQFDGTALRIIWGYEDDDNYWCIESLWGATGGNDRLRLIERVATVETAHESVSALFLRNLGGGSTFFTVCIRNGYINFATTGFDTGAFPTCMGPHTFPDSGRAGFGTGVNADPPLTIYEAVVASNLGGTSWSAFDTYTEIVAIDDCTYCEEC